MSDATSPSPALGRVAAVDWGRRRVGLAITDALRITIRGLDTVRARPTESQTVEEVARRLSEEGATRIVVGLPLHASGEESDSSRAARRFGEALAASSGIPVEFLDEGLTSWEAEEEVRARRRPLRDAERAGEVDRRAAMALLRTWLLEHA